MMVTKSSVSSSRKLRLTMFLIWDRGGSGRVAKFLQDLTLYGKYCSQLEILLPFFGQVCRSDRRTFDDSGIEG